MKFYIGITDSDWYNQLKALKPEEVNFWQPGGNTVFRVLPEEGLFLFKLHHPRNFIVGGGYFVRHSFLPVSMAWKAFGRANGVESIAQFMDRIRKYRRENMSHDPQIGCIILTQPFFLEESDWIPVPDSFKKNIVTGKSYESSEQESTYLINALRERIPATVVTSLTYPAAEPSARYGNPLLVKPRLGQGAFRVLVTESYHRRCAISGEKTLPVLEAAHIKPYAEQGPHLIRNGLLLRSDLHILFDQGYVTVTPDSHVLISKRIRQEFENGKDYYALDGTELKAVPERIQDRPSADFLSWHNQNRYLE
ncbi:MAG: HNH endonuclease [Elusimicrobiota bacterium]|nr:HNH endonuclease [Elusimicrobiota bacterium]